MNANGDVCWPSLIVNLPCALLLYVHVITAVIVGFVCPGWPRRAAVSLFMSLAVFVNLVIIVLVNLVTIVLSLAYPHWP